MSLIRTLVCSAAFAIAGLCAAASPTSIANVLPTMEGTTVTLAGTAGGWKDSWKPTAPNTFYLSDASGSIRVCIWPDDMAEVPPPVAEGLKKKGTPIRLSAEVELFREKVELHVKDGRSISLITGPAPASVAHPAQATPAAAVQPYGSAATAAR